MAVKVLDETEDAKGWSFSVRTSAIAERPDRTFTVHLSWADYDHWSRGARSPARVVEELVMLALESIDVEALAGEFDAARIRRMVPDLDTQLRHRL